MEVTRESNYRNSTSMANAMVDKYPWTVNAIADDLRMPLPSFRVWKLKMEKEGKILKPAINSLLCIPDPESRNRLLYSDDYVSKLRELRGQTRPKRTSDEMSLRNAKLKVLVPVYDENVAKFLLKKFGDEQGIQEYLKSHVIGLVKPVMNEIEELKREFERKMNELLGNA